MSAVPIPRVRPDRRALVSLAWRAAIVTLAAAAILLGVPEWLQTPLSLAAALVTVPIAVRRQRGTSVLHRVLIATGGAIVTLALLGLLLSGLPWGLHAGSWAVGVGLIELALLAVLALTPQPPVSAPSPRAPRSLIRSGAWGAAVAAVLVAAVLWSAASFGATHVEPLAISARAAGTSITVTVSSGSDRGPFRLDLVTATRRTVLARSVRVGPGAPVRTSLTLPAGTRGLVQLIPLNGTSSARELIVDSTSAAGARP